MAARAFDPFRLDVEAFANEAATLEGQWPLTGFDRLVESTPADARPTDADQVTWRVTGERRRLRGGDSQAWLHLTAETRLALECQRCLQPVEETLRVERSFLFVAGEEVAAQIDVDSEEDVLALSRAFDLRELIEDELLLAAPLVPRHKHCPEPLTLPPDDAPEADDDAPHPFAALATLKRGGPLN